MRDQGIKVISAGGQNSITHPETGDKVVWPIKDDEKSQALVRPSHLIHAAPTMARHGQASLKVTVGEMRETFARWLLAHHHAGGEVEDIFRIAYHAMRESMGHPLVAQALYVPFKVEKNLGPADSLREIGLTAQVGKIIGEDERTRYAATAAKILDLGFSTWGLCKIASKELNSAPDMSAVWGNLVRSCRTYLVLQLDHLDVADQANPLVNLFSSLKGDKREVLAYLREAAEVLMTEAIDPGMGPGGKYNSIAREAIAQRLEKLGDREGANAIRSTPQPGSVPDDSWTRTS